MTPFNCTHHFYFFISPAIIVIIKKLSKKTSMSYMRQRIYHEGEYYRLFMKAGFPVWWNAKSYYNTFSKYCYEHFTFDLVFLQTKSFFKCGWFVMFPNERILNGGMFVPYILTPLRSMNRTIFVLILDFKTFYTNSQIMRLIYQTKNYTTLWHATSSNECLVECTMLLITNFLENHCCQYKKCSFDCLWI